MNLNEVEMKRKEDTDFFEEVLGVKFSRSYREFLIQRGATKIAGYRIFGIPEVEKSPADVSKKIPEYAKAMARIVGFPEPPKLPDLSKMKASLQALKEAAEQLREKKSIEVTRYEDKVTEISVVEATEFLLKKRPDIVDRKLVPICFAMDLNADKQMALCMDLSENPEEDAPLVQISDINDQQTEPEEHTPGYFGEWLVFLKNSVKEIRCLKAARRKVENRNNEVLKTAFEKEFASGDFKKRFGTKCPVCELRARKTIVNYYTQQPKILLTCQECQDEWDKLNGKKSDFIEWLHKKVEDKGYNLPCFTHKGIKSIGGKRDKKVEPRHIKIKPQHWHTRIFQVTDHVVGLTAFRYSYKMSCLEVDAFWSGDLAGYVKGQAIRNLAIAVFCEANALTGSLALTFTKDVRENEKTGKIARKGWRKIAENLPELQKQEAEKNNGRIRCPVPRELVAFAEANYILLSQAEEGIISHQDGLNLFWAVLGWPEHLQAKVDELEKKGYLTKQALASIIYSGIWSKEEAVWLFENAPRPEAILLGSDLPEDRLYYTESLHWARSAYSAGLLKVKISNNLAEGLSVEEREESDCELKSNGRFWILRAVRDFNLPWMIKGSDPVPVKANEPALILSVPCQTTNPADGLKFIKEGFKMLKEADSDAKIRCLLLGFEFSDLQYGMKVSEAMKTNSQRLAEKNVYLLFSPYRLALLDDEAENRMASARRRRQFPSRKTPLSLQLVEIPEDRWQKPDLLYSVEDAKSAAYWIENKIDQRLGRIRFRTNCSCIERVAVQDTDAKLIATVDGQDSKDILAAMMSESGITLPFVLPEEIPEFAKKTNVKIRKVLKTVKGGLIVLTIFEKSEFSETIEPSIATAEAHSVDSGFQFPVNPEGVDFSSYAVNRQEEIAKTHQQIQHALRNGEPLAVSYLRHEIFVEALREYLFYDISYDVETVYEERRIVFFTERVKREKKVEIRSPAEPVGLRIVYNDGTEGKSFPLFCLSKWSKPEGLYPMKVGSISIRHVALDSVTDGYLIQNIMISKRKLSSSEQEDYAFRRTWYFLVNFVDLVQHKRVKEITQEIRFKYLWGALGMKDKKSKGCELHIFQTGLVPATVGIYRAVVKFLQERRGELVVVPRLIRRKAGVASKDEEETVDTAYLKAAEWF